MAHDDIENLTALKLYFQISPTEKLTLSTAVIWASWTEAVGNTIGNPNTAYVHPVNYYDDNYAIFSRSHDLGWEIDLNVSYKIMDGLTYSFASGVLLPGNSFEYNGWNGATEDWGAIWMISNTTNSSISRPVPV